MEGPKFRVFPSPATLFLLSSLSWGSSRGIMVVFLPQMCQHQACSSSTPPRDIDLQWCLVEGTACPHSSSYPPSKSFSCLADQRFFQPHHCFPQGLASAFLTSSLRLATAREQNVGGRFGQPQRCSALFRKCSRMIDRVKYNRSCLSDPSFLVVVTIVQIQERLSPSENTHQHVLQLSLLRRSRRVLSRSISLLHVAHVISKRFLNAFMAVVSTLWRHVSPHQLDCANLR